MKASRTWGAFFIFPCNPGVDLFLERWLPASIRPHFCTTLHRAMLPSGVVTMSNEQVFADRINRINHTARKQARVCKPRKTRSLGSVMVIPIMLTCFMAGGILFTWELLDRPTANPLEFASNLTNRVMSN